MRRSRWKLHIKLFKLGLSVENLKLPSKTKFSYIELKTFKARFKHTEATCAEIATGMKNRPRLKDMPNFNVL